MPDTGTSKIQGYYDLKSNFSQFAMLCEEQLAEKNDLIICFESVRDIAIDLAVFGQPLEISFSMAADAQEDVLGKLHFTRIPYDEKRQSIMTLYFNRYGYIRYLLDGPPTLYNICDRDSIKVVIVHLLATYARKNRLSYLDNLEIDPAIFEDSFLTEH